MGLTIKAIHKLIEKEYSYSDAKKIYRMIKDGKGLADIQFYFKRIGYGVEWIKLVHNNGEVDAIAYINSGDTYNPTFIRSRRNGKIIISTVGDLIESLPSTWRAI